MPGEGGLNASGPGRRHARGHQRDGLARSAPTLVRLPMSSPHGRSSNIGGAAYDPTYPIGRLLFTVRDGGARLAKPADGSDSAADRRPTSNVSLDDRTATHPDMACDRARLSFGRLLHVGGTPKRNRRPQTVAAAAALVAAATLMASCSSAINDSSGQSRPRPAAGD